jgi:hypothetical protein
MVDWIETADYDYEIRDYTAFDLPFVDINECLEKYEATPDTEMKFKVINGLEFYT